jgi:DNA polymerase elongation subunit (family B)
LRILALDIETRPNLAYVWGLWDQNIPLDALVESGDMICWAAKWLGEEEIMFSSVHHQNKRRMVKAIWKLLDEADAVLHFNGRRFDVPHLKREFLELGMPPPSPFRQIDLLQTCKKQFRFPSNKLEYVSKRLGMGGKVKHEGYRLWLRCMNGDDDAWELMKKYNIKDVTDLEELYGLLQPWIVGHPSHGAISGEDVCPRCGSDDLVKNGTQFLTTGAYPRFKCRNCGGYARGSKRIHSTTIVPVTD